MSVPYTEYTQKKNKRFYKIIKQNIITVKTIFDKSDFLDKTYYHFDINAGMGKDMAGKDGSVLQFMKLAEKYKINYYLICVEKNSDNYRNLKRNIIRHIRKYKYDKPINNEKDLFISYNNFGCKGEIEVINDDHNNVNLIFNEKNNDKKYGSIYTDPAGNIPSFELFRNFAKIYKRIDIIIHLATTTIKRAIGRGYRNETENLIKEMYSINKHKWIIQRPDNELTGYSKARYWTFLIGTNYKDKKMSKKLGFYDMDSMNGKQILYKLSYTKKERKNKSYLFLPEEKLYE